MGPLYRLPFGATPDLGKEKNFLSECYQGGEDAGCLVASPTDSCGGSRHPQGTRHPQKGWLSPTQGAFFRSAR